VGEECKGARVGESQINSKKKEWILKYINTAGIYGRYDTKEEANDIAKRINRGDSGMHVAVMTVSGVPGETVHAIDITPAMLDSVLTDGQALFQKTKAVPSPTWRSSPKASATISLGNR